MSFSSTRLLASALLILVACSASPSSSPTEAPTSAGESIGIEIGFSGEFPEIVARSQRAMILLERAENVLIDACMAEEGFEYIAPTDTDVGSLVNKVRIGELTPEIAEREGYGPNLPESAGDSDHNAELMERARDYFASLPGAEQQRYVAAVEGDGDAGAIQGASGISILMGGCIGEARRELFGDRVLEVFDTFNALQFLQVNVWAEPMVGQALDDWRDCMAASGYRYDTPDEAMNAGIELRVDGATPPDQERTLAASDAACRVESGLIVEVEAAFARLNDQVVLENEQLLTAWSELEQIVLDRAGDVLGVTLTPEPAAAGV